MNILAASPVFHVTGYNPVVVILHDLGHGHHPLVVHTLNAESLSLDQGDYYERDRLADALTRFSERVRDWHAKPGFEKALPLSPKLLDRLAAAARKEEHTRVFTAIPVLVYVPNGKFTNSEAAQDRIHALLRAEGMRSFIAEDFGDAVVHLPLGHALSADLASVCPRYGERGWEENLHVRCYRYVTMDNGDVRLARHGEPGDMWDVIVTRQRDGAPGRIVEEFTNIGTEGEARAKIAELEKRHGVTCEWISA